MNPFFFIGSTPQPSQKAYRTANHIANEFLNHSARVFYEDAPGESIGMLIQALPMPDAMSPGNWIYGGNSDARGAVNDLLQAPLIWPKVDQKEGLNELKRFNWELRNRALGLSKAIKGIRALEESHGPLMDEWFEYLRTRFHNIAAELNLLRGYVTATSRQIDKALILRTENKKAHGAYPTQGAYLFSHFAECIVQRLISEADSRQVRAEVEEFVIGQHDGFDLTPEGVRRKKKYAINFEITRSEFQKKRSTFMKSTLPRWKTRPFWERIETVATSLEKATGWSGLLP